LGRVRPTAERVSSNEARFAEANNAIALIAGTLPPREFVPFLCECPSARCSEIAELALGEYGALRLFSNRFLVAAGCRSGELPGTEIVERCERYAIVDRPTE
jgi:hypothetical protein